MRSRTYIGLLISALLVGTLANSLFAASDPQTGLIAVIVNGNRLTGPNSSAQTRAARMYVPVGAIARALGDRLEVNSTARTLKLDRQDGVAAAFDGRSGQVREDGVLVLSVSDGGQVAFAPGAEEMMLPIEIASALFDASMRYDSMTNTVIVSRGGPAAPVTRMGQAPRMVELYRADYEFNASGYAGSVGQNLTVNAAGRLGDARFLARAVSSSTALGQIAFRNASLEVERPNGQHFTAGDIATGIALPLIGSQVRGGSVSSPVGGIIITAFGGRARSGSVVPDDEDLNEPPAQDRRPSFDTNVYGVSATKNYSHLGFAAGIMRFDGRSRNGDLASTTMTFNGRKLRSQADLAIGRFRSVSSEGDQIKGGAFALDVTSTYQASDKLAVHARFAEIGRGFLTPQDGRREPVSLRAGGITYSPVRWLTTSLSASTGRRPGDEGRAESFVTAALGVSPSGQGTRIYLSHTQSSSRAYRSGAFTLLNASKEFSHWRLYLNASRIKTLGAANFNVQAGGNLSINDRHSIEVAQGVGSRRSMNGMLDWRVSQLARHRLSLTAGIGYNYGSSRLDTYQRVSASLRLPRETSVQASYMNTATGPAVLIQFRGALFRRRQSAALLGMPVTEINTLTSLTGRVYQDNDGDGTYDPAVDTARPDVKIRLDGSRYVVTDANGNFTFDAVPSGTHSVYLDLLSVRADLTLVDGAARNVELTGGRASGVDFRLVRTGRVTGRVFFDENGNGSFDDGELPLADIRVMTAGGRDTLTDADGFFVIADLPPGEHIIFIDEKTLPEKTVAATRSLTLNVFAGKETNGIALPAQNAPAEVKRFGKRD